MALMLARDACHAPRTLTPDIPVLHGTEWWLQSLILPPSGSPYFGDPGVFRLL